MTKLKFIKTGLLSHALYAAAIWGSTFFLVKDSLQSVDPVVMVGYRFLLAAILLAAYLLYKKVNIFINLKYGFIN